ncbi:hypothetical protein SLEP1_g27022 [Rubroshorea leprosula]|uniref:Uncharacterized protein n=1 Tax=Rubroshorea leprosula TaxID=152421 RepID=A0AAV5JW63_9ROSI|nr:hypothetical protein SLEP1_g27022 [Rubroshorea leprosula]
MCVNNKSRATPITRDSKSLSYTTHDGRADVGGGILEEMRLRCIHPLLSCLINSNYGLLSSKGNFSWWSSKAKEK